VTRGAPALLAPALLALAGCTTSGSSVSQGEFVAISTRPSVLGYAIDDTMPRTRDVEVVLRSHMILWIPTDTQPPTLEQAIEEALRRGRGDVLVNAVVDHFWWYVPPFYGQEGWRVVGDVVRTRLPTLQEPPPAEPGSPP
jgi:hypothetical protein